MPKYKLRAGILHNALDHLMRSAPVIMISRQPTLWHIIFIVLVHVILVGGKEPRSAFGQIQLHHSETGRVAGRMLEIDAWRKLDKVAVECFPVQIHVQILWNICTYLAVSADIPSCSLLRVDVPKSVLVKTLKYACFNSSSWTQIGTSVPLKYESPPA